jgi:hypothetical protein
MSLNTANGLPSSNVHSLDRINPREFEDRSSAAKSSDEPSLSDPVVVRIPIPPVIAGASVRRWSFSPDGKILAVSLGPFSSHWLGFEHLVFLFDVNTGKEIRRLAGAEKTRIESFTFSPDSKQLLVQESGVSRCLWNLQTGEKIARVKGPIGGTFTFAPDDSVLLGVSAPNDQPLNVHVWDALSGKLLRHFGSEWGRIRDFRLSADGKMLVTEHRTYYVRWGEGYNDGRRGATLSTHLWEVATGKHLGQVGSDVRVPIEEDDHINKLHEVGAGANGFRVRISPAGRIFLSPPWGNLPPPPSEQRSGASASKSREEEAARLHFHQNDWIFRAADLSRDRKTLIATGWLKAEGAFRRQTGQPLILIRDVSKAIRPKSPPRPVTHAELDAWWGDLASADVSRAYPAARGLAEAPREALAFVREHVRPAPVRDQERLAQLVADLDADRYAVRERAEREIASWGEAAAPTLRKALKQPPSTEARTRMERLLDQAKASALAPETFQGLWTVELLEHLATPEARELLKLLSSGDSSAWITREAKASLERLGRHPEKKP